MRKKRKYVNLNLTETVNWCHKKILKLNAVDNLKKLGYVTIYFYYFFGIGQARSGNKLLMRGFGKNEFNTIRKLISQNVFYVRKLINRKGDYCEFFSLG